MKHLLNFVTVIILGVSCMLGALFFIGSHSTIDFSVLQEYESGKPSLLLDDQGNEWARFALDKREPITISMMPIGLVNAFIAAEDWNFFKHSGISWKGIIRSSVVNIYHGKIIQGASTITQQLVKLLFFDGQKTFTRKIKEQFYSLLVERTLSKQQILQTYLNHIYFGCGIYGVQAAAQRFWGIPVADLTIDQMATLAAVVKSPARYCPLLCVGQAYNRRNVVLKNMAYLGFITQDQYLHYAAKPIVLCAQKNECAPHLREMIRIQLEERFGKQLLYTGGLQIQTTLNQKIQRNAQQAFNNHIGQLRKTLDPKIDGALISIDPQTGAMNAFIGGYDFGASKFNRATQAYRQMGSVFKPFIYGAAIQAGTSLAQTAVDEPYNFTTSNGSWSPKNHDSSFAGTMTLARALAFSNNIISVKTLLDIGYAPVLDVIKKCQIAVDCKPYPALGLGCVDATLQRVVGGFNIFANGGIFVQPYCIKWIKDSLDTKVWKHSPVQAVALDRKAAHQVCNVLETSINRFKRFCATWPDMACMGKTGTTNDSRTCWFCGATPNLTTAVYIGADDNKSLGKDVYAFRTAFPIWLGVHSQLNGDKKEFAYDKSLKRTSINWRTGDPSADLSDPEVVTILV